MRELDAERATANTQHHQLVGELCVLRRPQNLNVAC
jgi:hypothetical protein